MNIYLNKGIHRKAGTLLKQLLVRAIAIGTDKRRKSQIELQRSEGQKKTVEKIDVRTAAHRNPILDRWTLKQVNGQKGKRMIRSTTT